MGERLRAVLVGAGRRAESAVLPVLNARADVDLVAIVEVNPERSAEIGDRFGVRSRFASHSEFSRAGLACDVAFLATPPWLHERPFLELVGMGLHVYCEKSLAYSLAEAEAMASAAEQSDKVTMIGFDRRFSVLGATLKELCEQVAPASFVHVSKSKPDRPERQRMLIENAVHVLDLLCYLVPGDWTEISACGDSFDADGLAEKRIAATVRFADGCLASFHQIRVGGGSVERIEAYGDGWTAVADMSGELTLHCRKYTPNAVAAGQLQPLDDRRTRYQVRGGDGMAALAVKAFLDAVRSGDRSPVSAAAALRTQRLCDAILRQAGLSPL